MTIQELEEKYLTKIEEVKDKIKALEEVIPEDDFDRLRNSNEKYMLYAVMAEYYGFIHELIELEKMK